jgi:hypothetical protein
VIHAYRVAVNSCLASASSSALAGGFLWVIGVAAQRLVDRWTSEGYPVVFAEIGARPARASMRSVS